MARDIEVAREPGFTGFVGPLADRGWERYRQMSEAEREAAREAVERDEGPDDGGPEGDGAPGRPPAHEGGTW